ncbi:MAG: glycosyltransferase family 2 protein [Nitrospirota bacterium]
MVIDVSIIIPCRNEERFIGKCLDSIIENNYPKDYLEVLVVDGMSVDETRGVVEKYTRQYSFIRLLENPKKIIPSAMNIGIKNAKGKIIMKVDSHASYEKNYISKCIRYLDRYNADNVGGVVIAISRDNKLISKAIVLSISNPFGVGNSLFRIGTKEPVWADTAFSGCYRKEVFDRIGLYDENIARSEDVAINSRLRRAGGRILLVPEIKIYYYARSNFSDFCKHNFDNGFWITYPLTFGRILFSWRHLIPLAFVSILIGSFCLWGLSSSSGFLSLLGFWLFAAIILSYSLLNFYFSGKIALLHKDFKYFVVMPIVFASLHIGYGIGSLWGLLRVVISQKFWKNLLLKVETAA